MIRVSCPQCEKQFKLPEHKTPNQRFAFPCPKCGFRITVDPTLTEEMKLSELKPPAMKSDGGPGSIEIALDKPAIQADEDPDATKPTGLVPPVAKPVQQTSVPTPSPEPPPAAGAPAAGAPAAGAPAAGAPAAGAPAAGTTVAGTPADATRLPRLRPHEEELLAQTSPLAFVVDLGLPPNSALDAGLNLLGLEEIRHFEDLGAACDGLLETEAAVMLIRMEKASAPPCEPLAPLENLPFGIRRRVFVALMAENVTSLDGQVAFFLQVNCLINGKEGSKMPALLRRAWLHHLRLYRHWSVETE